MNSADPGVISPGLIGFLATFGIVVVSVLLFLSMTRHLRKVSYRSQHLPEQPADERPDGAGDTDDGDTGADRPGEP